MARYGIEEETDSSPVSRVVARSLLFQALCQMGCIKRSASAFPLGHNGMENSSFISNVLA